MNLRAFGLSLAAILFTACSSSNALTGANPALVGSRTLSPLTGRPSFLAIRAVTETVLHSFVGGTSDGSTPIGGLTKVGNVFYGTTVTGGSGDGGTIYSISASGAGFTVLHSFKGKAHSVADLINVNGTLYGTSPDGGAQGKGTVFSISPAGAFTTLYSFKGGSADGANPQAGLTSVRGTLYGTTSSGGNVHNGACLNCGTVFSISTSGQEKVLYFFGSKADDGIEPRSALVNVGGKLYGTTSNGGDGGVTGDGTIFSVTTGGKEAVLHKFKYGSDGSCSAGCYLNNLNGTLYGTACRGGKNNIGSVFSITLGGAFKTLYSASTHGNAGGYPKAALAGAGNTLYGTMSQGPLGKNNGTLFSITPGGALKVIYTFGGGSDGATPMSRLILIGSKLFGTTSKGGTKNLGTVYSIAGF